MTDLERKLFERRLVRLEQDQPLLRPPGALMIFLLAVVALGLMLIYAIAHPPLPATIAAGAAVGVALPLFLLGRRHARRRR